MPGIGSQRACWRPHETLILPPFLVASHLDTRGSRPPEALEGKDREPRARQPNARGFHLERVRVSVRWTEAAGSLREHVAAQSPAAWKLGPPSDHPALCAHSGLTDRTEAKEGKREPPTRSLQIPVALFTLNDPTDSSPVHGSGRGRAGHCTKGGPSIPSSSCRYC